MTNLKRLFRNKTAVWGALAALSFCAPGWSFQAQSPDGLIVLTKDLQGASGGVGLSGGPYTLSFSLGEPAAGYTITTSSIELDSGYWGGRFGAGQTFSMISVQVGSGKPLYEYGLQVGVPLQASVQITFSDEVDMDSVSTGILGSALVDHMGQTQNTSIPLSASADATGQVVKLSPQNGWQGNTLYDIALTPNLISVNGYTLGTPTHIQFLTMLDPHQENVVISPLGNSTSGGAPQGTPPSTPLAGLQMDILSSSLTDYSTVLYNDSPLTAPLAADPNILREANRKAQLQGGLYQTPVAYAELAAYDSKGDPVAALSAAAQLSLSYNASGSLVSGPAVPVRPASLALWALDTTHALWVKIPASSVNGLLVSAPVTKFSVFALMGSAFGSASDAYVFPIPWRPHGPNAGTGSGQTGTEAQGMTFSSLPSECTIRIYTLSGELVREMHHSDLSGTTAQETWDGKTGSGERAASGVYLWRVESPQDGKNGKLMIIR